MTSRSIGPFHSARVLAVLGVRRLSGTFLAWQRVLPLSSTVSTRRLVPETSVLASAPTCHDSTNFSKKTSSNKGLGYTQNFGKKLEKRRDEWGATSARQTTLSLSLFLSLTLSYSLSFVWTRNEGPRHLTHTLTLTLTLALTLTPTPTPTPNCVPIHTMFLMEIHCLTPPAAFFCS